MRICEGSYRGSEPTTFRLGVKDPQHILTKGRLPQRLIEILQDQGESVNQLILDAADMSSDVEGEDGFPISAARLVAHPTET